jgi:hypothetical protein
MTTTFGNILTVLWEMLPDEWANHPGVWWKIMDTIPLDQQCKNAMLQLIGRWSKNYKQWSTGSLPALKKKIGKTADTMCQMSLPANQLDELKDWLSEWLNEREISEEDLSSYLSTAIRITVPMSTPSTAAPTQTGRAGATSKRSPKRKRTLDDFFESLHPSKRSSEAIGKISQSIFVRKGDEQRSLKSTVPYKDFLLKLQIYPTLSYQAKFEGGSHSGLENCHDPLDNNDERKRGIEPKGDGGTRSRKRRGVGNAGGDGGIRGDTGVILDLIKRYAVCPLSEIVYTREYLENPIAVKRLDDRDVKNAIDCHAAIINTWNRQDYVKFYEDPNTVKIWSARNVDSVELYYLTDNESRDIINKLLDYQCGLAKKQFVTDLINVTDMNIPKCNCFLIVSPPSAGKNFLCDAIKDYYINVGQMQNPNKYNTFAYQDCHNRRLLIWNEPNYEPRETENLKMLFGGDNLSANVKCKPQANVKRTPVICMSNVVPRFANHEAFADRVITYYWNAAPFLKEVIKKTTS